MNKMNDIDKIFQCLSLISIIPLINDEQSIQALETIMKFPQWFKVLEPVQEGDNYIYTIKYTDEFFKLIK